jgi:hypothetical protein
MLLLSLVLAGCPLNDREDESNPGQVPDSDVAASHPPTISGTPPTAVVVEQRYSFTPSASDADGDALVFHIQNKPDWMTFDATTGRLDGVAPPGSEGIYDNITVGVSDGILHSFLPPFTVEVTQFALGSVTLSWLPPSENTDGTPISDLAGFKIYYGLSDDSFPLSIFIDNPGITLYVVDNLVPNTYYFVATSINSAGVESNRSNVAMRIVN